jgi:hypothetical protein
VGDASGDDGDVGGDPCSPVAVKVLRLDVPPGSTKRLTAEAFLNSAEV